MKPIRLFLAMTFIVQLAFVSAQNPVAVLTAADVDKFIKTVNPMNAELEALGYSSSGEDNDQLMEALLTDAKVIAIVKKYGWDVNTLSVKWMSIGMCYAKLKMDQQLEMLPAEQREMAKQMMKETGQNFQTMINEADLKLVKAKEAQLDQVMTADR